ncbi:MAG: UDP-glucose/GDP-mannose dehydrogenase family protein [candidate division NC10 bacterium]|nr:UDP-glucose/GDP-mannose dehydrogenase family protein [candidate division NC10 bacterium]
MSRIGVIGGTGYVGLVTATGLAELGHTVVAVDIDRERIENIHKGILPIYEAGLEELVKKNLTAGRLRFTLDIGEGVKGAEILFIAVGTPAKEDGEADLSQIIMVAEDLVRVMRGYCIIAIKSTVPVGTFEMVSNIFTAQGKKRGKDYDLVSNPEFLREGKAVYDFFHPDRVVVGGDSPESTEKVAALFAPLQAPLIKTTICNAQMIKYASNVFLATRVSFINEIANICEHVGADVVEVARGMGLDRRIGHSYLDAGIGFGGPCLIKDLKALIKMAENYGYEANFLREVFEKNEHQIRSIVAKVKKALGSVLYGKTIGILGLTFKAGTDDVRTSLSLRIIEALEREGAHVRAHDPKGMPQAAKLLPGRVLCEDPYQVAEGSDALLLLTGWEEFKSLDMARIKASLKNPVVVDGVNLLQPEEMRKSGFSYLGVGR